MFEFTTANKGVITLGDKVMVSDPCYDIGIWCQGVLENVLSGQYQCAVEYGDSGDNDVRVSAIQVTHADYINFPQEYTEEEFEVGVDSGQAGIFDYEYYVNYHGLWNEDGVNHDWYNRVCSLTLTSEKNPNYKEFDFDWNDPDSIPKIEKYMRDWAVSQMFFHKPDANIIDNAGFVSSSGYGDGGYICLTVRNDEEKVVSIRVEFITEYDEECVENDS